jgi:hypothetical protein
MKPFAERAVLSALVCSQATPASRFAGFGRRARFEKRLSAGENADRLDEHATRSFAEQVE